MPPSGPAATRLGLLNRLGSAGRSRTSPVVVALARRFPSKAAIHNAPSGPVASPDGPEPGVIANSATSPAGVMRPTRSPAASVNQRLPSGPAAISAGLALAFG